MTDYLARLGETLVGNGYAVIPIVPGTKRPPGWMSHEKGDPWSAVTPDVARVRKWRADSRLSNAGVGINLGRNTFALDVDVRDPTLAMEVDAWIAKNLPSGAPRRIGEAPKCLYVFRVDDPIRKIASRAFLDDQGRKCQVEGLGQGEQFVAYAIHPDTKKPYRWVDEDLIEVAHADLPLITVAQVRSLVTAFEEMCERRQYKPEKAARSLATLDNDDWTSNVDNGPIKITPENLRRAVFAVPNDDIGGTADYDTWLQVGMALWHQTEGQEDGLDLWSEWSAQSSKHVKAECERKWRSFDASGKDQKPITARYIIRLAGERLREKAQENLADVKQAISAADSEEALRQAAAKAKSLELDALSREIIAHMVQRKFKSRLDVPVTIGMCRNLVRFEAPGDPERPKWLEKWVYISATNEFFNRITQTAMKPEAFDNAFARELIKENERREGKAMPDLRPSDFALNIVQIEVVDQRVYMPSVSEDIFTYAGRRCVNTYTDRLVPKVPASLSDGDRTAIRVIEQHVQWLLPDRREADLMLSFLSHVAKGGRVRWAILLHGVEGVGKTFWFQLMGAVLGSNNVRTIAPRELEKEFTPWAEGSQFNCIEEIRLHGHSRYDVINALKPHITNDEISVRKMRMDSYMAPNTASYMALTNYADALPIDNRDRRYMILSAAPSTADVVARGTDYFVTLFDAVKNHAGAVLGWLQGYQPHPEFNADGRAPRTVHRDRLMDLVESEEVRAIRDVMEDANGRPGVSPYLLSTTILDAALLDAGHATFQTRTLNRVLMDMGLTLLGRYRYNGERHRWWSNQPSDWLIDGQVDSERIRSWMEDDL